MLRSSDTSSSRAEPRNEHYVQGAKAVETGGPHTPHRRFFRLPQYHQTPSSFWECQECRRSPGDPLVLVTQTREGSAGPQLGLAAAAGARGRARGQGGTWAPVPGPGFGGRRPQHKPDLIRVTHALKINKLSIPSAFHIAASGKMGDSFSEVQRRKRSRGSDRFKSPIKSKRTVVNATASLSPIQRALGTSKLYQACLADCTSVHAANCNDT